MYFSESLNNNEIREKLNKYNYNYKIYEKFKEKIDDDISSI